MTRTYSENPKIQSFYEEHGAFVTIPDTDWLLFEDGAKLERISGGVGVGVMMPPPRDNWEGAKLVAQYFEIIAQAADDAFHEFREYCRGNGVTRASVNSPQQKIDHLKKLKGRATAAHAKLRKAKNEMKELTPFWMVQRKKDEAAERRRRQNFLNEVEQIQL